MQIQLKIKKTYTFSYLQIIKGFTTKKNQKQSSNKQRLTLPVNV